MSAFDIVLAVVVTVVVLLVLGGIVASGRAARKRESRLGHQLEEADRALATARAADQGWDATRMEAAIRTAVPGAERLQLVRVLDRPGTDADEAVYRVADATGQQRDIRLRRTGDAWSA